MYDLLLLCVEECQTILSPQRIVTTTLFVREKFYNFGAIRQRLGIVSDCKRVN
jgi:hypothetical protein